MFPLDILITSTYSHNVSALIILLNGLLFLFRNIRVPLVGAVSVGVKPVRMISGGFGSPPALYRGVEPTCCIYYGLFSHNHAYGRSIPLCIVGASWGGENERLRSIRGDAFSDSCISLPNAINPI